MLETIKYLNDGVDFLLKSGGKEFTPEGPVPESGVAYLQTSNGPRVVVFPNYAVDGAGSKPAVNKIYELRAMTTTVEGTCASAEAIEAAAEEDDEEVDDDDSDEEDEIEDDDELDDDEFGDAIEEDDDEE